MLAFSLETGPNSSTNLIESCDLSTIRSYSVKDQQQLLVVHFHKLITAGSSLKEVNNYYKIFFDNVRDEAKKVGLCIFLFTL